MPIKYVDYMNNKGTGDLRLVINLNHYPDSWHTITEAQEWLNSAITEHTKHYRHGNAAWGYETRQPDCNNVYIVKVHPVTGKEKKVAGYQII